MSNRILPPVVRRSALCMFAALCSIQCVAQDLTGIKCVVDGERNASESARAEYKDGQIYLCCEGCLKAFKSDSDQFATRANHQLVLTKQYKQTKCPISGGELDLHVAANVGGTKIRFSCERCLKKVTEETEMAKRAEMVFGNNAFEKSFSKVEPEIDLSEARCVLQPDRQVSGDFSTEHGRGKIFFCCQKCTDAFTAEPEKHAIAANHQLVLTGQYVQTGCPVSGSAANEQQVVEVLGVKVKLCCGKCVSAVSAADSDDAKATLVFSQQAFAKSFKPASEVQPVAAVVKQ